MATPVLDQNFVEINPGLAQWLNQNKGTNFANPAGAYEYQFGPGSVVSGQSLYDQGARDIALNANYFMPNSGTLQPRNALPEYDQATWLDYGYLLPLAVAGGGLLAGAMGGAGGAAAGAGELGAAAGGEVGAGLGGEVFAGSGGDLIGGAGADLLGEGVGGAVADAGAGGTTTINGINGPITVDNGAISGALNGGGFNPLTDLPPGTTSAVNSFGGDTYDMPDDLTGGGTYDLPDDMVKPGSGGFDWSKFLSGSGSGWANLLGTGLGALLPLLAANTQVKSAEEANALMWAMYQQNRADLAPWREAGVGALGNLTNMTTPGNQFTAMQADPGYQWRLNQGNQAIDRGLASRGMYNSGRALKELTRYGQGFASNEFGNIFNRNATLAGFGQNATNTGVNNTQTTSGALANNITGAGNANASGYIGAGNAITGGLANYINQSNQDAWMQALVNGRTNPYG